MKSLVLALFLSAAAISSAAEVIAMPGQSPLITFRIVFRAGSAVDPPGKAGVAALTASMLADGGTKHRAYKQLIEAMYPMATRVSSQVDKELTTFTATTHVENLQAFYGLLREMLLEPGFRADDLSRLKDEQVNYIRVSLRANNDEELGKEVLYETLYAEHPYGRLNEGRAGEVQKLTLEDVKAFYATHYSQANLMLGVAGGYPKGFVEKVQKDFANLPEGKPLRVSVPAPKAPAGLNLVIVDKPTRSVAYSIGHPIPVKRGDPDYAALLVAQSYFGYHRNSWGRLFTRMREVRGLNYGDYAYVEYFPRGMYQFEPDPNLARQRQIFQIWIRPVEPSTAHFALRLGMYEFDRLVKEGIPEEAFERTRTFLAKNVNLLLKTKSAELGYAIDSKFYGIPEYGGYLKAELAKLTRDDVNRAIRKHLDPRNAVVVAVSPDAEKLRASLLAGEKSSMTYNSPKPDDITEEDKIVESWKLPFQAGKVTILPVDKVFE